MSLGPFDVTPAQIDRLDNGFTTFVNRLLDAEVAAHELRGHTLSVTANETTPDGGVDAALRDATGSGWLPAGDSAWQFKRTNLGPKKCADEFAKASWAHEFVRDGGAYVIITKSSLTDNLVEGRRKAVAKKAVELGLLTSDDPDRIRVYDSNQLARWTSRFPALAVSQLLGGPGSSASDFDYWSRSRTHQASWTPDHHRTEAIAAIRSQVTSTGLVEIRVQGDSGIGKSRLVLEALREDSLRPLVAYVADERQVDGDLIAHLVEEGRSAVLVVDDCAADRHVKLAERLPAEPGVKLVTIGSAGLVASPAPAVAVGVLPEEQTDSFLKSNYPQLSSEARRFITGHTRGNTRWTILFADRLTGAEAAQAADLIERNDIEAFVTTLLPEGRAFFLSAVLALVERVGWDRELRSQLEVLASFSGATVLEFEDVGRELERRGLLIRQGRYRAVSPHPLAVFLAAEAWRTESDRIVGELLPQLSEEMALSLFTRVADLGRFQPARSVLPGLLSSSGPFGSLLALDEGHTAKLLTQLAIVLPDEVTGHLAALIQSASLDELTNLTSLRRDLVWTLEKLVWHRRTFGSAAGMLLRLARAENETWANNATGTWIDLFGTMLPGTAATPSERMAYLEEVASDERAETRLLVVKACARALAGPHESIGVSGELQAGVLVEPRGSAKSWEEVGAYQRGAILLLRGLAEDTDPAVSKAAIDALIQAVHPLIDDELVGDDLISALACLRNEDLTRLRRDIESLINLQERHGGAEGRNLIQRLHELTAALPPPTEREELMVLLQLRRWDLQDTELQARLLELVTRLEARDREWMLDLLETEVFAAAWEFGHALARGTDTDRDLEKELVAAFSVNPDALLGYLHGRVENGDESVFDRFLEGPAVKSFEPRDVLVLTARGPATDKSKRRIMRLAHEVPVAQATSALFGWQRNLSEDETAGLAAEWSKRLQTQDDYNALLDWLSLPRAEGEGLEAGLRSVALTHVMMRDAFPDVRQQGWEWSRLASQFVSEKPVELARLILDLIDTDRLTVHAGDHESQILVEALNARPEGVWTEIGQRLMNGSWRLQMEIRGWLLAGLPVNVVEEWVGNDIDRARVVASVAPVGGSSPTPVARLLLGLFPDDDNIRSSLWGDFMSGSWMGPESARLESQIEQMRAWQKDEQSTGVRKWATAMLEYLQKNLERAREQEAERGY